MILLKLEIKRLFRGIYGPDIHIFHIIMRRKSLVLASSFWRVGQISWKSQRKFLRFRHKLLVLMVDFRLINLNPRLLFYSLISNVMNFLFKQFRRSINKILKRLSLETLIKAIKGLRFVHTTKRALPTNLQRNTSIISFI